MKYLILAVALLVAGGALGADEVKTKRFALGAGLDTTIGLFEGARVLRISTDQELRTRAIQDEHSGMVSTIPRVRHPNPTITTGAATTTWYRILSDTYVAWNVIEVAADSLWVHNYSSTDSAHVWVEWR